ncbi:MAG: aminotransferase class V-fold PLP-dependent enzyme [Thermoleophilia bacterium]
MSSVIGQVETVSLPSEGEPAYDLQAWRRRIPILKSMIVMNNCSQAPQLDVTREAAEAYLDSWNKAGMDWDAWMAETHKAKVEFARLINASPDDIAVSSSVSEVTASLAGSLDLSGERRRLVTTEAEFPSVAYVWQAHAKYGLEVDWVPVRDDIVDIEDYDGAIDERTLLVSACHAYYQNGYLQDVAAIARKAHDSGALLYVDAYQTMGVSTVDVQAMDIDFLASGNLKFLLGVPGIAFLYVRPGLVEHLEPAATGWFGRANPFSFDVRDMDLAPTAARFDTGTPPVINAYISRAGMAAINEIGVGAIAAWTQQLTRRLIEGGRARGFQLHGIDDPRRKTPSTAFVCPEGESHHVEALLLKRGILAAARGPVIRLAPHFYNTLDDVDLALDALSAVFEEDLSA